MSNSEIASKLGMAKTRVEGSVSAYNVTVGTPFEKLISFGSGTGKGNIPESLIWKIQTTLSRAMGGKITKEDWELLLPAIEQDKVTSRNITMLRAILMTYKNMDLKGALDILDESKLVYTDLCLNRKELVKAMRNVKIDNEAQFIKYIIKEYNEDLLF